jgi:serine/threonine protein kinase
MLPLTPTKLGRYEIVDEIGKGAMGVVYLARDPLIGRLVALKTFRIGYSIRDQELEQFRARFIREAQSAGILSHPNIVTIHDVVEESEDGLAFIAMEYVRGTNLKALLQGDQPLSLPFVVDVVSQVADALDYAHSHRVVHRDVKPANILITADNRVKITDFGIARLDTSNLTQEGQLLGTPNYMSPEQIQGREIDHRADLFALGVVLYEMLTRHKPFQGENLTVVSHRIVYDHFTPPREYMREMPPGIEPILQKALEKDPARRYQRAKEMVDDLRRLSGMLAGADLNETQSLSMIAPVLTPPPHLPTAPFPPPAHDTTGSLSSPSLSATNPGTSGTMSSTYGTYGSAGAATPVPPPIPAAVKPAKAAKPAKPPRSGPLVSPRRVAVAAGAGVLLVLLAAAGLFLWLTMTTPKEGRDAQQDAANIRLFDLLRTGSQMMHAGNPTAAAAAYLEAEKLEPKAAKIHQARLAAEQQASQLGQLAGLQKEKSDRLVEAQQALDARRWDDAVTAATAALAIDPSDLYAQQVLAAAQQGQARAHAPTPTRTPRRGQPEVASTQPTFEPTPTHTEPRAPEPVSQVSTLRITFDSELAGASVLIYAGKDKLVQTSVGERGGLLRKGRGGHFENSYSIAPGAADLRVYVTPPGQKAILKTVSGNFLGGQARRLEIQLSEGAAPSVTLH